MKLKKVLVYGSCIFVAVCIFIILALPQIPNCAAVIILVAGLLGIGFNSTLAAESKEQS